MKYPPLCGMAWSTLFPIAGTQPWTPDHSGFWFRICGYGLHVSTKKRKDALFSERYGYRKALYLFGVRFEVLWA